MATIKGPEGYSINNQHDYMTLKTPYGNYTNSYGGEKLSGQLCTIKGPLLDRLKNYLEKYVSEHKGSNFGQAMEDLMKNFVKVVPEVKDLKTETVEPGDVVKFNEDFAKKYPGEYVVYKVTGKNAFITIGKDKIGFPIYAISKTGKKGEYEKPWEAIPLRTGQKIKLPSHPELGPLTVVTYSKMRATVKDAAGKGYNLKPSSTRYEVLE